MSSYLNPLPLGHHHQHYPISMVIHSTPRAATTVTPSHSSPMHPLSTASATSFLFTLLLFFQLTASSPWNDASDLSNCNQTFSCGDLTNITYPFTGGQLPSHCGPPEFHLWCYDNRTTTVIANSLPYRVTQGYSEEEFFKIGGPVFDPRFMEKCPPNFQVPFLPSWAQQLQANGSSSLVEVLKEGFDVSYRNPYSADCQKCYKHSGGQCGFDGVPICICDDQICPGK
ncbi:hypothetical protein OIU76_029608 [Salix suchowensis]|nr:hypothetical protein OIU76_029608 [Salix suchowensis]